MESEDQRELETMEMELLLEAIYDHYGYDFRDYARASLTRRVLNVVRAEKLSSVSGLREGVLRDPAFMERFLLALTVNETSMFRDPHFFLAFRTEVVPFLRTYPFIRLWSAGCAPGEEAYSLAILLEEEGLYDRSRIYSTDLNEAVLRRAREGICPLPAMKEYAENYLQAGGKRRLSDYCVAAYDHAIFTTSLKRNIVFGQHNLVTDSSFNEFQAILCRNVMIYFNRSLQNRVHHLLYESLIRWGVLCLGSHESLKFSSHEKDYEELVGQQKIYRKMANDLKPQVMPGHRRPASARNRGGLVVVQDPAPAENRVMPQACLDACRVEHLLPMAEIAPFLGAAGAGGGQVLEGRCPRGRQYRSQ